MKCSEIIKILKHFRRAAWHVTGTIQGFSKAQRKEVKTIFLAVDATDSVIEQAEQAGRI